MRSASPSPLRRSSSPPPSSAALLALRLARSTGLAAPAGVFGAADGLGRHFAHAPLEGFFDGLGEVWLCDTLAVKRVPGCAYVSAAAEAASDLAAQFHRAKGRPPAPGDVVMALAIAQRKRISFLDAMIVRAAAALGAEILWTEDLADGQSYEGVLVKNPFRG